MSTEDTRIRELQAQMDAWQAELDSLESWPETRIEHKERIEALREKLHLGAEKLSEWRYGGHLEIP
jgi:hypothetical protein